MGEILNRVGVPAGWHVAVAALGAMVALATLDFLGAVAAKEWSLARHPGWMAAGFVCFALLFVVYGASLAFAELSVVTFGWVVFLQVGILLYERVRFGVVLPPDKLAAMLLIVALQAWLILRPTAPPAVAGGALPAPSPTAVAAES
jgi:hypothetical protein